MTYPRVEFSIQVPCGSDEVGANIAHARSLGPPMADADPIKTLTIVANGPSARLFVSRTAHWEVDILTVNGSLKLCLDAGITPKFWAACDPQALVADFLPDNPPEQTTYLVASKCHPSVFQKLQGRDVRLWDIDDHPTTKDTPRAVPVASSITLCVQTLMRDAFGYRHFEIYGWDACFGENLEHHAGERLSEPPDNFVQVTVGAKPVAAPNIPGWLLERHRFTTVVETYDLTNARTFDTTATWAAEAQDATILTHYSTSTVRVHGDGLVKAILESR